MVENDDFDVSITYVGKKPNPVYFFPVITFVVLLYFNRVGLTLDSGYVSALLGISIVSVMVQTAFIGFGLITDEWYEITSRARNLRGELIIAGLSLFSTQLTFFVLGFYDYWLPTRDNVLWFIYGFIIYQFMWVAFTYFYTKNRLGDNRLSAFFGIASAVIIGIIPVYVAMGGF